MRKPLHPTLYQINTRVWLTELSRALGRTATLDDIADAEPDRVAGSGFDWVWLLSVWRTGPAGRAIRLEDLMGPARYDRDGGDLVSRGLYLDMPAWGYHVFDVTAG